MRRADRLAQLIQILRRARQPITAEDIAEQLQTSRRTVYRDIAQLMAQRAPIRGEAGVGYLMDGQYEMPPLLLTPDEVDAAVLGAQWVISRADPAQARAAHDLLAKIAAAVPERLRPVVLDPASRPELAATGGDGLDMAAIRAQMHAGRKIVLRYADDKGAISERTIWPITMAYLQTARLLVGWCERREDFRHFRIDRIVALKLLDEEIPERLSALRARWLTSRIRSRVSR